jgi:hypothetical protein
MRNENKNPFAGYGPIVSGDRFIGRRTDLKAIESRVIRPLEAGNLAIIGEPRIGKSSLVWKAVMDRREELVAKRLLPIWLNLGSFDNSLTFFRALVRKCYGELKKLQLVTEPIELAKQDTLKDYLSWEEESYEMIQSFFEKVRQAEIRVLFILDEFDHARILFKNNISGFQRLRELSYRPEWRVTFIVTSRRTIKHIELQTAAISTFDGIFLTHYLGMFEPTDMDSYFKRLSTTNFPVDEVSRKQIEDHAGGYPFLLEMLGFELVERFYESQKINVEQSMKGLERSFLDHYDRLIKLMEEEGRFKKLLQILFGPVIDVEQTDVEDFLRYGLIKPTQEVYQAFSKHFHTYLKLVGRSVNLWPLWRDTEVGLRRLITETMLDKYGETWVEELEKNNSHLKEIFDRCRNDQKREIDSFGSRASHNLLDFTYPKELFTIIVAKKEWDKFKPILGKDKQYWELRSQLLARVRNPLAHNRDQVLHEHERQIAEGYCKEILSILQEVAKVL